MPGYQTLRRFRFARLAAIAIFGGALALLLSRPASSQTIPPIGPPPSRPYAMLRSDPAYSMPAVAVNRLQAAFETRAWLFTPMGFAWWGAAHERSAFGVWGWPLWNEEMDFEAAPYGK